MKNKKYEINRKKFIITSVKEATVLAASGLVSSCSFFTGDDKEHVPERPFGKTGINV